MFNPPSRNSPPVRVGMLAIGGDSERNSVSARFSANIFAERDLAARECGGSLRRSKEKESTDVSPWSFNNLLPRSLIGKTRDSGSRFLGSSPSGAAIVDNYPKLRLAVQ